MGKGKASEAAALLARLRAESLTAEERSDIARLGGLAGGKARAAALTPAQRKKIAQKAARARWAKAK